MQTYYIRHKIQEGDFTHLADSDSEVAISNSLLKVEDPVLLGSPSGTYLSRVVFIDKSTVELEVMEKSNLSTDKIINENPEKRLVLIQSLSNDSKFNILLEKSVEIGVDEIIPVESHYSLLKTNKAIKKAGLWTKIISDASEQSRNLHPTHIQKAQKLDEINLESYKSYKKLCFVTESVPNISNLKEIQQSLGSNDILIAIGPETGWHSKDHEYFKQMGFEYVTLQGNILRTETAGIVISTIMKYLQGHF